jgi:predicted RNase H-like HicB family nuclease
MTRRQYTIDYEHDATGWWVVSVRGVRGCHTQGRTIEQGRERIREALALVVGDAAARSATFRENVKLPAPTRQALAEHRAARSRAETEAQRALCATRAAVQKLTDLGLKK